MNRFQTEALRSLRSAGYAVVTWTPEELRDANPRRVEDRSIELGHQVISDLADPEFKPDDERDEGEVLLPPPGTAASVDQYVDQSGALCPFCGSSNVEAQNLEMDGACAWSDCTCNDCNKEWKDEYALTGYSVKE